MDKHKRITGAARGTLAAELKTAYESGWVQLAWRDWLTRGLTHRLPRGGRVRSSAIPGPVCPSPTPQRPPTQSAWAMLLAGPSYGRQLSSRTHTA